MFDLSVSYKNEYFTQVVLNFPPPVNLLIENMRDKIFQKFSDDKIWKTYKMPVLSGKYKLLVVGYR